MAIKIKMVRNVNKSEYVPGKNLTANLILSSPSGGSSHYCPAALINTKEIQGDHYSHHNRNLWKKKKKGLPPREGVIPALPRALTLEPSVPKSSSRLTVLTVRSLPAVTTDTLVGVNAIDAGATVFTGVALAVVDIWERKHGQTEELKGQSCSHRGTAWSLSQLPP